MVLCSQKCKLRLGFGEFLVPGKEAALHEESVKYHLPRCKEAVEQVGGSLFPRGWV